MKNEKKSHICENKQIYKRFDESGPFIIVQGAELWTIPFNLYMFIKIKKNKLKNAELYVCTICGKYKWKCPYCGSMTTLDTVPRTHVCETCGNESYFDPYKDGIDYLFQSGKKP